MTVAAIPNIRRSQSAWKVGSSGSISTVPWTSAPPRSWTHSTMGRTLTVHWSVGNGAGVSPGAIEGRRAWSARGLLACGCFALAGRARLMSLLRSVSHRWLERAERDAARCDHPDGCDVWGSIDPPITQRASLKRDSAEGDGSDSGAGRVASAPVYEDLTYE